MRGLEKVVVVCAAGRENADAITEIRERPGHVEGRPNGDTVSEILCKDSCVISEISGKVTVGPAAAIFQHLGQVPVVQRAEGADARFEQSVNESSVVIETFLIGRSDAGGLDA